ncbi:hypothetical protein BpHYR1_052104 [Brachionus plicatilis]|uniref:Uncharacterized protein n=1 Tax=Brachionus plicatilis TaxID=10195 RepID=A0A3M7RPV4_BRAPC|nr:hypothetical protein BpHYR1_052104 [Brachionus plicatilis]
MKLVLGKWLNQTRSSEVLNDLKKFVQILRNLTPVDEKITSENQSISYKDFIFYKMSWQSGLLMHKTNKKLKA